MIARLAEDSKRALPTPFHNMLRTLDNRGKLLRVYSQNIDALEQKAGLTFGVPEPDVKRSKPRSTKGSPDTPVEVPIALDPSVSADAGGRLPTPPAETPRCIPLHGTLQSMHCQICLHSFPLEQYLDHLNEGVLPICPECSQIEETRQAVGKRSRGVGKLRPSVVLYNELHKDGEEVGEVVQRDLLGASKGKGRTGADLLIVVGTSLRVPGTKRMVREFSKAIRSRSATAPSSQNDSSSSTIPSSAQRSASEDEDTPIKTIYLNLDFPVPTREWEGVFDVWLRGDAQTFAQLVQEEIGREERAKEAAIERKKRREEMKAEAALQAAQAEETRARIEAESRAKINKDNNKKTKVSSRTKPKPHSTLGKRKTPDGDTGATPLKKSKSQLSKAVQTSKTKTGISSQREKLVVKFPGTVWSKAVSKERTPPSSPRRHKPDGLLPPLSASRSASSSPLTSLASSPQLPAYSGFSSPLSEIPSSSSLPSRGRSPDLFTKARSPAKCNVFLDLPVTPDDSPNSTPPPSRSYRRLSLSTATHPSHPSHMQRLSSSYKTLPSSSRSIPPLPTVSVEDVMMVDVESLDIDGNSQTAAYPPIRVTRPGLRPRLPVQR
jgi:NAD-dependent SIR2 family protein deacetylase